MAKIPRETTHEKSLRLIREARRPEYAKHLPHSVYRQVGFITDFSESPKKQDYKH